MTTQLPKQRGFTLAEMAIVLILMGMALSMGLKMVTSTLENAAYSETKAKQERIKIALIGFLRTNGRLPCPDNSGDAVVATGVEALPANCTALENGYGVIPWQTLGLPVDAVLDGWGNFFSYRVANVNIPATDPLGAPPLHLFPNQNWTINAGAGGFDIRSLSSTTTLAGYQSLRIESLAGTTVESRNAVAVIISHGKNGFGAKTVKVGARMSTAGAGADEITNASDSSTTFIRRAVTEDAGPDGTKAYDDLVMYMSPQDLLQPLVSEGTLKSCVAYCPVIPSCTASGTLSCTGGTSPVSYCTVAGPACTASGSVSCSAGIPQCILPGTGCSAVAIPIGLSTATCA